MRKIILAAVMLFSVNNYSQDKDKLSIISKTDEMDGSISYKTSKNLECVKDDFSIGFNIYPAIKNDYSTDFFIVHAFKIGNCDENGELLFLFEDNSNLALTSFSEFDCSGSQAFMFKDENTKILSAKKIKKIRYTNGRSGESYTSDVKIMDQDYFISFFELLKKAKLD